MSTNIQKIEAIVEQGRTAFADGKNLHDNPYPNDPQLQMHWADGFKQAAAGALVVQAEVEQVEDTQPQEETEEQSEDEQSEDEQPQDNE